MISAVNVKVTYMYKSRRTSCILNCLFIVHTLYNIEMNIHKYIIFTNLFNLHLYITLDFFVFSDIKSKNIRDTLVNFVS